MTRHVDERGCVAIRNEAGDVIFRRDIVWSAAIEPSSEVFVGASLVNAQLEAADLSDANLQGADCRGASFYMAFLYQTDFRNANLEGAHLRGVDMIRARLDGANLRNADLRPSLIGTFTELSGAHLRDADLTGARLLGVLYDHFTLLPDGFYAPDHGMIAVADLKEFDIVSWFDTHRAEILEGYRG